MDPHGPLLTHLHTTCCDLHGICTLSVFLPSHTPWLTGCEAEGASFSQVPVRGSERGDRRGQLRGGGRPLEPPRRAGPGMDILFIASSVHRRAAERALHVCYSNRRVYVIEPALPGRTGPGGRGQPAAPGCGHQPGETDIDVRQRGRRTRGRGLLPAAQCSFMTRLGIFPTSTMPTQSTRLYLSTIVHRRTATLADAAVPYM